MKNYFDDCDKIKNLFSSYIDEEITEDEKLEVDQHIDACQNCAAELSSLKQLSQKIQNFLTINPPEDFDLSQSILNRLTTQDKINCETFDENISAFFDGELDPKMYYSVEEHLNDCEICHQKYKKLEAVRNLIQLSVNALDIDFWNTVYYRLISSKDLDCQFVIDEISAYIDKELDLEIINSITDHVRTCEYCTETLRKTQKVQKEIQSAMLSVSKNIDLWPKVFYKLNHTNRQKTFVCSAAASIFMVCLVWTVLSLVFPAENIYINTTPAKIADTTSTSASTSNLPVSNVNYVAKSMNTPENYLFSNVYDVPPSGIIPVLYDEGGEITCDK